MSEDVKDVMDTWPARIVYGVSIFAYCAAVLGLVLEPWFRTLARCTA